MKFTAFATLFAALLVSGHAAAVPEANTVATPEANVAGQNIAAVKDTIETPAADANPGKKANRKMKKDPSGSLGTCKFCCDDDYHC